MPEPATDIVVGVDESASARAAARWAAAWAGAFGLPIRLVHAQVPGVVPAAPDPLAAAADVVRGSVPDARLSVSTHSGAADDLLISESAHARLVVLGSRGVSDRPGGEAGAVAIAVSSHAHCPVVVVRGRTTDQAPPTAGPIVVGVDGSLFGDAALALASEFAQTSGEPIIAVHAWTEVGVEPGGWRASRGAADETHARERHELTSRLASWRAMYPGVTVHELVVHDRPVRGLLAATNPPDRPAAQLLVVGSRGLAVPTGMGLGSTSHSLLHYATCPVAVARPEQIHLR